MKKYALIYLVFFLIFQLGYSQKVKIKKETAFVNNQEYCIFKKEGNILNQTLSVYNLLGEELVFLKLKNKGSSIYYNVKFLEADKEINMLHNPLSNFRKSFVKKMYNSNLMNSNRIDTLALRKFMIKYDEEIPDPVDNSSLDIFEEDSRRVVVVNNNGGTHYEKVMRDTTEEIAVYGNRIQQDFKTIGNIERTTRNYIFYVGESKIKVATVKFFSDGMDEKAIISTTSDNRIVTIAVEFITRKEDVAKYLVRRNYL